MTAVQETPPACRYRGRPSLTAQQIANRDCGFGHSLPANTINLVRHYGFWFCPVCIATPRRGGERPMGATHCSNGHDITGPGALSKHGRCRECRLVTQHRYQEKLKQLKQRRTETSAVPLKADPAYFGAKVPPVEVRMGAACGPDTAHLFDKRRGHEPLTDVANRHKMARRICWSCPVRELCGEWYAGEPADTMTVAAL